MKRILLSASLMIVITLTFGCNNNNNDEINQLKTQITELENLRNQEWLINEASLKLYVDQDKMISGDNEPERIFIFDTESGSILVDYFDGTLNETNPINSVTSHLERLTRDSDENGEFYKIRITQHIINILNRGEENVKLGISVSQNVNITTRLGDVLVLQRRATILNYSLLRAAPIISGPDLLGRLVCLFVCPEIS